jgi:hypothetical protein
LIPPTSAPIPRLRPPVADARGRKILDAILADKNVDILVIPITGAVVLFSEPFTRYHRGLEDCDQTDLRHLGRSSRHRRHNVVDAACRYSARSTLREGGGHAPTTALRDEVQVAVRERLTEPSPAAKKARKLLPVRRAARSEWNSATAEGLRHQDVARRPVRSSAAAVKAAKQPASVVMSVVA